MFNLEEFDIKLDTEVFGRNFIYIEEIESTNSYLLNEKEQGKHGSVCLAEFQTAGRGRRDRSWQSVKEQNLLFSILVKNKLDKLNVNILNLGASLAVAHALENLYQLKVNLKWPNDVLVDGKKIAGILLDSSSRGSSLEKVVIGFGINVNQANFQGKFLIPPTSIRNEFKNIVSREKLLSEILNNYEEVFDTALTNAPKILDDWRERCRMIGERVKIEDGEFTRSGVFDNIDDEGYLVLRTQQGTERISFGDVSLR